ncbi:MAG TPA: MarC family protein [Candidatus Baltobacteraceae bacterium]|jgi:multiple antibiotic resistance protein|nr:MarC family protein [Candidatus Baltobacteraceae bacterium]
MTLGEYTLSAVSSIFVILDPIAMVPAFIAMTPNDTPQEKLRMARLACWVAAGVLLLFAAAGNEIFKLMGITLPAFQLAGSILILRIALDMLYARRSPARETDEEVAAGAAKDDIAITPLGVPMLAGPGAISTVLILLAQAKGISQVVVLLAAIPFVCFISYWVFWAAVHGTNYLKPLALKLATRLFGLLLAAMAVQFIFNALEQTPFFKK